MRKQPGVTGSHRGWSIACALLIGAGAATGAHAQIAFDDVSIAAGFANSATETWGASWGDLDGDHYPDIFVSNHRMRAALYHNNRDGTFTDVSKQVDLSQTRGWTGGRSNVDTHGATWIDIDNDGDEDLFQTVSSDTNILSINNNGLLTDATLAHGIDRLSSRANRQYLFFDYNGDGLPDIAAMSTSGPALYPQKSDGTFGKAQAMACDYDAQWGHLADLDNNGGLDLICAERSGSYPKVNSFAGGVPTDITAQFPPLNQIDDAAVLDYNGDLKPDLFVVRNSEHTSDAYQVDANRIEMQLITVANKTKAVKFKTTGTVTFTVSTRAGVETDGDPTNIWIGSHNYRPTSLQFTLDSSNPNNAGIGVGSPGINIGYLSETGEWEITQGNAHVGASYVQVASSTPDITGLTLIGASGADLGMAPYLMKNTGTGLVRDTKAGFTAKVQCVSAVAGDFDNDMHEDIFMACTAGAHNLQNRLFRNNGNGKFTEVALGGGAAGVTGAAVADHAGTSESVVAADYDLDGFLDLFVVNGLNMRPAYMGGPKQLFHNRGLAGGNTNHWMEFDLVGTNSNRDGIGSKVYVTAGGVKQYREQNGGYHRYSQNFQRVHVGLAGNTQADVQVVWPDGTSTNYTGLDANHIYQLKQDGTRVQLP